MRTSSDYSAIVIGASAGGGQAIPRLLTGLPANPHLPIIIVQHRSGDDRSLLEEALQRKITVKVKQVDEKEEVTAGIVYVAPPNYHLLVERDRTFSLSCDPPVKYARPSIDILFETAAEVYQEKLIAIVLTGANDDGARGIVSVSEYGGLTIAQDPTEAQFPAMPTGAIRTGKVVRVLTLDSINEFLIELTEYGKDKDQ